MPMQTFYDYMEIPEKCLLNKPLFKKLFQEHTELDTTDKKALKDDIEKIHWIYTLKTSTINIPPYRDTIREYDEIAIIQINLSNVNRAQRIANFINKAIPYPIILIFNLSNTIAISVADKRINQADKSKWVVEDAWMTKWFNPDMPNEAQQQFMQDMGIKNLSFVNFYSFYTDIKNRVIALNSATRNGNYQIVSSEKTQERQQNLTQIIKLEREIAELRTTLKKETQFNKKLSLNISIKERQDAIKQLEQSL
jgi:hypothetical protein